jgi:hypothetical protein
VKNFPISAKVLAILGALAGMRGLTAGLLGGAWLLMADGAASKVMRWSGNKSVLDSTLGNAASLLPVRVAASWTSH